MPGMKWYAKHPDVVVETLGMIPLFLNANDPRPAREQFNENYAHGGGWRPMPGWQLGQGCLIYPGDPPFPLLAETRLRDEVVRVYNGAWVAIIQPDGAFEVSHMD